MRSKIIVSFILIALLSWLLLPEFTFRNYFILIPLLFTVQILLNDSLETYLAGKLKANFFNLLIAPGTVVHELSHALMAKLTGCRIERISLFNPGQRVLGFVEYTQPGDGFRLYRSLLIGFAPFFGCGLFLVAVFNYLAQQNPDITVIGPGLVEVGGLGGILPTMLSVMKKFFGQLIYLDLSNPVILLILYLEYSISLGSAPSSRDFMDVFSSLLRYKLQAIVLVLLIAAFILLTNYMPESGLITPVFGWMILLLLISLSLLMLSLPLAYMLVTLMEVRGIHRIIPFLLFTLTYFSLAELGFPREYTFISSMVFFLSSLLIIRHHGFFIKPE